MAGPIRLLLLLCIVAALAQYTFGADNLHGYKLRGATTSFDADVVGIYAFRPSERLVLLLSGELFTASDSETLAWTPVLANVSRVIHRPLTDAVYAILNNSEIHVSEAANQAFVKLEYPQKSKKAGVPQLRFHPTNPGVYLVSMDNEYQIAYPSSSETKWYSFNETESIGVCEFVDDVAEPDAAGKIIASYVFHVRLATGSKLFVFRLEDRGSLHLSNIILETGNNVNLDSRVLRFNLIANGTAIIFLASTSQYDGTAGLARTYISYLPWGAVPPQLIDSNSEFPDGTLCGGECNYHVVAATLRRLLVVFAPTSELQCDPLTRSKFGVLAATTIPTTSENRSVTVRGVLDRVYVGSCAGGTGHAQVRRADTGIVYANIFDETLQSPVTLLSFDDAMSQDWVAAKVSETDAQDAGEPLFFTDLHSISFTSALPGFALGAAVVSNQVGKRTPALYATNDGGKTWHHVRDGRHTFAFTGHSGRYAYIPQNSATLAVAYDFLASVNVTATLNETRGAQPILSTAQDSIVAVVTAQPKGAIVELFSNSRDKNFCGGTELENFVPFDGCLLGKQIYYTFRKRESTCMLPEPATISFSVCKCTRQDYVCHDLAHPQPDESKRCPILGSAQPQECPAGQKYFQHAAYKRISESACDGGLILDAPIERVCESEPFVTSITRIPLPRLDTFIHFRGQQRMFLEQYQRPLWFSIDWGQTWTRSSLKTIGCESSKETGEFYAGLTDRLAYWDSGLTTLPQYMPYPPLDKLLQLNRVDILPHPYLHGTVFLNFISDYQLSRSQSYFSTNSGATWLPVSQTGLRDCTWASLSEKLSKWDKYAMHCTNETELLTSLDFFKSIAHKTPRATGFKVYNEHTLVSALGDGETHTEKLFILKPDLGEPVEAQFYNYDGEIVELYNIAFYQSTSDVIFVFNIDNRNSDGSLELPTASLYKQIAKPNIFVLMTSSMRISQGDPSDIVEVTSTKGRFIANFITKLPRSPFETQRMDYNVFTMMSVDNAKTWKRLSPPKTYNNGTETPCLHDGSPSCNTHLQFWPYYDGPGRSGQLIGSGNVGPILASPDETYLYVSNDFGNTWKEMSMSPKFIDSYAGDSLLVSIGVGDNVTLEYSADGGNTVSRDPLFSLPLNDIEQVIDISRNSSVQDNTKLFLGRAELTDTMHMYIVKFNPKHFKACEANDLEVKTSCVFGKNIETTFRKAGVSCVINEPLQRSVSTNCACTVDDYDCDIGFLKSDDGKCKPKKPVELVCDGKKNRQRSGYVKSLISTCVGGIEHDQYEEYSCHPARSFWWSLFKWVFYILMFLFMCLWLNALVKWQTGLSIRVHWQAFYSRFARPYAQLPSEPQQILSSAPREPSLSLAPGEVSVTI